MDRATWGRLLRSPVPAFLLASLALFALHEPWRDEAQPWLVARDAPNLFQELDSETHPPLWYLLAFPLAKLGLPFESLRVVHLAIAVAALCVFALHAPFSRLETWLYAFGYFVLYEYAVIARNYAVLVLVLYVLLATWRTRFQRPWLHGALLFLLTQTHAHGVLLAGVLSAAYGLEWLASRRALGARPLVALALAAAGALASYLVMAPAPDVATWRTSWNTSLDLGSIATTAHALIHVFAPIPRLAEWTWGSTYLENALLPIVYVPLAALLWVAATLAFRRHAQAMSLWVAGSVVLLVIYHTKSGVSAQTRHHGLLFVWFIACLWLARMGTPRAAGPTSSAHASRLGAAALAFLLVLHVASVVPPVVFDAAREFSGGPGGARFLVENGYADESTFIGVYPSFIASPVLAQLPATKTQVWLMQVREYGSYVRFTHEDAATFGGDFEAMLRDYDAERERVGAPRALVITSYWLGERPDLVLLDQHDSLSPGDGVYVYERVAPAAG